MSCRLAVLASHPIQYFTPIYRRLATIPDLEVEVMFYRDFGVRERYDEQFGRSIAWDTDQLSGYRSRFLANVSPITNTFNPLHAINPGAFVRLLRRFDAVWLNGYTYPSNWLAAFAAGRTGATILLRSELRLAPDRRPRWTDAVRERIIRWWVSRSAALLYIGEENRRAYLHYGARPEQLFFTPYACDVDAIAAARHRACADPRRARERWGIPAGKLVLLFAGKLTPRKHPEAAIDLALDPEWKMQVHLIVAGSGPLEGALKQRVSEAGADNVSFLGFINQSQLPDVYAVADIFLMPSEREPWGVVLNEAMAAGAVPIVSDAVGAAADLVTPERTGLRFPSSNWEAMRTALAMVIRDDELRRTLSEGAMERAAEYGYEAAAHGVENALQSLGLLGRVDQPREHAAAEGRGA